MPVSSVKSVCVDVKTARRTGVDCESFKTHMKSDAQRVSHDRIDATLGADIKLQSLEHMHSFNVVAQ
jgi:hypothetical protein